MSLIIGTGGHVDHGKSSIIEYLTKVAPDKLKEEKIRGLTIIPSFIPFKNDYNEVISFIDVPGHEKFINNMIKGSHGIDILLLVVAADDGIMPQTIEHLSIAFYLGIKRIILVINKIDLSIEKRIINIETKLKEIFQKNEFTILNIFHTSCRSGEGLEELSEYFKKERFYKESEPDLSIFRMPIDRVFRMAGSGLIVTGTVISGKAELNDIINISGSENSQARIRDIEVHGKKTKLIGKGQRGGLNIVLKDRIQSLDECICYSGNSKETSDYCIAVFYSKAEKKILRGEYLFYTGTYKSSVKIKCIKTFEKQQIRKTDNDFFYRYKQVISISMRSPIFIQWGDKFIIRNSRSKDTIGGGRILFPIFDSKRRKLFPIFNNESDFFDPKVGIIRSSAFISDFNMFYPIDFRTFELIFPYKSDYIHKTLKDLKKIFVYERRVNGTIKSIMGYNNFKKLSDHIYNALINLHDENKEIESFSFKELLGFIQKNKRIYSESIVLESLYFYFQGIKNEGLNEKTILDRQRIEYKSGKCRIKSIKKIFPKKMLKQRKIILNAFLNAEPYRPLSLASLLNDFADFTSKDIKFILEYLCFENIIIKIAEDIYIKKDYIKNINLYLIDFFSKNRVLKLSDYKKKFKAGRRASIFILEFFDTIGHTVRIDSSRECGPQLLTQENSLL